MADYKGATRYLPTVHKTSTKYAFRMETFPQQGPNLKRLHNILLLMLRIQLRFPLWILRRCIRRKPVTFNRSR